MSQKTASTPRHLRLFRPSLRNHGAVAYAHLPYRQGEGPKEILWAKS